jgi:hypothetical protein
MLLTDIAEQLTTLLNTSPEEWTTESDVVARTTLDWATCLRKSTLQVLVVPEMVQYNIEQSQRRLTFTNANTMKFISIMVGRGFNDLPTDDDVAPWSECKALMDTRERITQFIIANPLEGIDLMDIEEIPVDELELNHRNFIAVNQLGYQVIQCGSRPGSSYSLTASVEKLGREQRLASIKQRLSSG